MTRVAVATSSQLAADAAAEVAAAGGNAVDCAIAAAFLTMNTEPGVCALAGGAYVTVWAPGAEPVTIDGNVAVPGADSGQPARNDGIASVQMDYGGGVETLVGAGSVAVPGSLAALEMAASQYGVAPWRTLLEPTVRAIRDGFPLPAACHYYLAYSGKPIFGRAADGYDALHERATGEQADDALRPVGSRIKVPHLADSLAHIAAEGAQVFYRGELARAMSEHCRERGGRLSMRDLANYRAIARPALSTRLGDWTIATNPPPAVGGAVLCAMLSLFAQHPVQAWDRDALKWLVDVQLACLNFRKQHLDLAEDIGAATRQLLALARSGTAPNDWVSASTVHTSAVDDNGLACAITASSGYGSGEMPSGTGLWLNNCLGELELNRRGLDAGPPGTRLPSNMAPSVACNGDEVLAIGSPGADRITTALLQSLVNALQIGMPLEQAIAHPRLHVDTTGDVARLMSEPGLTLPALELPVNTSASIGMYFGGVGAAAFKPGTGFCVAADPRRAGGVCEA